MGIIVQKFGGTSLRNINLNSDFLKHIKNELKKGNKLVVVVSAMGRYGDPYATDTLIKQLENINAKINPKKKDLIMSVGEIISAAIVSHLLEVEGIPSEALTGFQAGILTDDTFTSSRIIGVNSTKILKNLNKDKVVVVAGFQGATEDLEITTLGRGGSDTTAVALGGSLRADRVDIFTDVPGVAFTDPRIVPNVRFIKKLSYDETYRLANEGAKVIHPKAVLLGKKHNVPIRILSTFTDDDGTLITKEESMLKILGIVLNKIDDDKSRVSLLFNVAYRDEVVNKFYEYILDEISVIDTEYLSDKIIVTVENDSLAGFVQRLYNNFIN
jgi:aspartate kinase